LDHELDSCGQERLPPDRGYQPGWSSLVDGLWVGSSGCGVVDWAEWKDWLGSQKDLDPPDSPPPGTTELDDDIMNNGHTRTWARGCCRMGGGTGRILVDREYNDGGRCSLFFLFAIALERNAWERLVVGSPLLSFLLVPFSFALLASTTF